MADDYTERVMREAMAAVSGGLDAEAIEDAAEKACRAIQKQMTALEAADYSQSEHKTTCPKCATAFKVTLPIPNPTAVARATSHTVKGLDEIYRLAAFARGLPDSRPDLGGVTRDLFSILTADQIATVEAWIAAAHGRA